MTTTITKDEILLSKWTYHIGETYVRQLNPTLLNQIPRGQLGTEEGPDDVCYYKHHRHPNGVVMDDDDPSGRGNNQSIGGDQATADDNDASVVVYCHELDDGKRYSVGSWYLSPERHLIEYVAVTALCVLILYLVIPRLSPYQRPPPYYHPSTTKEEEEEDDNTTTTSNKKSMKSEQEQQSKNRNTTMTRSNNTNEERTTMIDNNDDAQQLLQTLRPPRFLRYITLLCFTLMITYKSLGYNGKLLYVVMPCNVNWILAMILSYTPSTILSPEGAHAILQMWIGLSGLAVVAVSTPDLSDLTLFMEIPYFFINHCLLAVYHYYFLVTNRISTLPVIPSSPPSSSSSSSSFVLLGEHTIVGKFLLWWTVNMVSFALFYITFVTPLGIISGMNLNYMLHPPNDMVPGGDNYRIVSCCAVGAMFFMMRLITTVIELVVRSIIANFRVRTAGAVVVVVPNNKSKKDM